MRRTVLALLSSVLAVVVVAGCGNGDTAQDQARAACSSYKNTGRVQVATTVAEHDAIVATAKRQISAAAAADSQWSTLSNDMQEALAVRPDGNTPSGEDFFKVDSRVQAECKDAGRDIGDLLP